MNQEKLSKQFVTWRSKLGIQPGEEQLVGLMLLYALFIGAPGLLTETVAYSLFLTRFDADAIPYIYIGFAIFTTFSGILYTKLEKRVSFAKFITLNTIFLTVILVCFRFLIESTSSKWSITALAVWYEASWVLANLGFWSLAVYLFDVRQGKRLFALVGAGLILSESIVGFFVPALVAFIGTKNLLWVAVISFVIALLIQSIILWSHADQRLSHAEEDDEDIQTQPSLKNLTKNPYILLIFAFSALYIIAFFTLDNLFFERLEVLYSDPDRLASFIGVFFGLTGLVSVAFGALISGKLVDRHGVRFGLLILPLILLLTTGLILVNHIVLATMTLTALLVIGAKFVNELLAHTINKAAWQVLYKPLPVNQQLPTQTVVDGMVIPISGGVAGVFLLVMSNTIGLGVIQLSYTLSIVLIIWLAIVILINKAYPKMLFQALAERELQNERKDLKRDTHNKTLLENSLNSQQPAVVFYALDKLIKLEPELAPNLLAGLLRHPVPEIRIKALTSVETLALTSHIPLLKQIVNDNEAPPAVRGAALSTVSRLEGEQSLPELTQYLDSPDHQIRLSAMMGLLHLGASDSTLLLRVNELVKALVHSPCASDREFVLQVLANSASPTRPNRLLLMLLQDDNLNVRRMALTAAKTVQVPETWPPAIKALAWPSLRREAVATLAAAGEKVLPTIKIAFSRPAQDRTVLLHLPDVCRQIGGDQAVNLLKKNLAHPDEQIRSAVLSALSQCGYQAQISEQNVIHRHLHSEAAQATWTLASLRDLEDNPAFELLSQALRDRLRQHRDRLFYLLSFIYDAQLVLQAQNAFGIEVVPNSNTAFAIELIDVIAQSDLKPIILPFLQDLTLDQRLEQLEVEFPQVRLSHLERLREIITKREPNFSPWFQSCALYTVGKVAAVELSEAVTAAIPFAGPLVRDTAIWTLTELDSTFSKSYVGSTRTNHTPDSNCTTGHYRERDLDILPLIEKILCLKRSNIFDQLAEFALIEIAQALDTINVKSGQTIIDIGSRSDAIYIIVTGQVTIHKNQYVIDELSSFESFGELSLLTPDPSPVKIVADQDTQLLKLEQDHILTVIDNYPAVARKMLETLAWRIHQLESQPSPTAIILPENLEVQVIT